MNYLNYIILPITKWSELEQQDNETLHKTFEFDKWLSEPLNIEIFNRYPTIKMELENEFIALFKNPKRLILNDFIYCVFNIEHKYFKELNNFNNYHTLNPFNKDYFEMSDQERLFYNIFQSHKKAIVDLPTIINGIEIILGKNIRYSSVLSYNVLKYFDMETYKRNIDFSQYEDFKYIEYECVDIFNKIEEAKRKGCDFFVYG